MDAALIERLAREAGFVEYELDDGTTDAFDKRYARFAAMVAEECAKEVEDFEEASEGTAAPYIRAKFKLP